MDEYEGRDHDIVVASSLLHDVGIKISEQTFGYNNAKTHEEFGPPVAKDILSKVQFPEDKLEIVCNIVGNHHTPSRYDYVELKILKRADKIVNRNDNN